ncbi:unnamed protein product [Rhodiola kirilowii]
MEMLENQVAQQAVALKQFGKLPSQPDVNSTEHINAITLKSGRVLPTPQGKLNSNEKEIEAEVANEILKLNFKLLWKKRKKRKNRF